MEKLIQYFEILKQAPKRVILMEPKESANFYFKHIDEARIYLPFIKDCDTVLDIGTGAGFPGIPLSIMKEGANFILADRRKIHTAFLKSVKDSLNLHNVTVLNARADEISEKISNNVDIVCARAVSRIRNILTWSEPILKRYGLVLLGKGNEIENEIESAKALPYELIEKCRTDFGFLVVYRKLV